MREILFRGKTTKDKEWVCGDLLHDGYDYDVAIWEQKYKLVTEISPETVGQFTGLTDNNGKKIFEGDILYVHDRLLKCTAPFHEFRGVVEHKNGSFVIVGDLMTHYRWIDYDITVLGNIHDNPELLEATT